VKVIVPPASHVAPLRVAVSLIGSPTIAGSDSGFEAFV
jgi:hypothetical protein